MPKAKIQDEAEPNWCMRHPAPVAYDGKDCPACKAMSELRVGVPRKNER